MENAILKAEEGGYDLRVYRGDESRAFALFLDPEFWKCCGKAEGWTKKSRLYWLYMHIDEPTQIHARWQNEMHSFIDHLAEGGTADDFFNKLLTPTK